MGVRAVLGAVALGSLVACGSGEAAPKPYVANPEHDAGSDSPPAVDAHPDRHSGDAGNEAAPDADTDAPSDAPSADRALPDVLPDAQVTACAAGLTRGSRSLLGVSTANDERFGSISDDELTLAFSVTEGSSVELFVAERTQSGDPFGTPTRLAGDFALDRAALTPDGLTLIAVNGDRRGFTRFARSARDQPFELASSSHYDGIVAGLRANEHLGDPVFALGGHVLLFSQYGGDRINTVVFANRLSNESAFDVGAELTNPELAAQGVARRRPTGVSADYTTLFFFDEVSGTSRAGSFSGSFSFTAVTELGAVSGVQPSGDCSAFYFDAQGASSRDLFSAR